MLDKLKSFFEFASKNGLYLPAAYDAVSGQPSVSLLLTHISAWVTTGAITYLIFKDVIAGTIAATIYLTLMITFYLMRKLTRAKFDLDDKSVDLSNDDKG